MASAIGIEAFPTHQLLGQLVKNAVLRSELTTRIINLDADNKTKLALIKSIESEASAKHAETLLQSLEPNRAPRLANPILNAEAWEEIGKVLERKLFSARREKGERETFTEPNRLNRKTYVYFIESLPTRNIKIGKSVNPEERLRSIQLISPG